MKIDINEKACLKHKLTTTEVLLVLAARTADNLEEIISNMVNREIFVNNNGKLMITQHWNDEVDEVICSDIIDDKTLMELADRIRECFPKTSQPDKFGRPTRYFFRCNRREVMLALKRFYKAYYDALEDITPDDIIDATKRYVASFNGNYQGMRLAKYFIIKNPVKQDSEGGNYVDQVSELMTYLDNKDVEEIVSGDDWLMNVRN